MRSLPSFLCRNPGAGVRRRAVLQPAELDVSRQEPAPQGAQDGFGLTRHTHPREKRSQVGSDFERFEAEAIGQFGGRFFLRQKMEGVALGGRDEQQSVLVTDYRRPTKRLRSPTETTRQATTTRFAVLDREFLWSLAGVCARFTERCGPISVSRRRTVETNRPIVDPPRG